MKYKLTLIAYLTVFVNACTTFYDRTISSVDENYSENLCLNIKKQYRELGSPSKMMIIQTASWSAIQANAQLVEKNSLGQWEVVHDPFFFVVGRNGMGLGFNFSQFATELSAPVKIEGDGKTPAGLHLMGKKFGFESKFYSDTNYRQLTANTYCVDDVQSNYYNSIVNLDADKSIEYNWKSSEKMLNTNLYKIGAEINYKSNAQKAAGSCIFMHLWREPTKGTAGCVASSRTNLETVLNFAKDNTPLLIAIFPKDVYTKVKNCL